MGTTVYVTNLDQGVTNDDIRVYSGTSLRFKVLCLFLALRGEKFLNKFALSRSSLVRLER